MKRYAFSIFAVVLIFISLTSCTSDDTDEEKIIYAKGIVTSIRQLYLEAAVFNSDIISSPEMFIEHGGSMDELSREYGGELWVRASSDPRLQHIDSIQDIRDSFEAVFTAEFAEYRSLSWMFDRLYREIDGNLYGRAAAPPNIWNWTTDYIRIINPDEYRFTALVSVDDYWRDWRDSAKLIFINTPKGWRIDYIEYQLEGAPVPIQRVEN